MTSPILGADLSNHNHPDGAPIDFVAVKASGRAYVVLKASEGLGFKDPYLDQDRAAAHAAGLLVLLYHFGRGNDPAAEASWFLQCVGALQPGEGAVIDDEVAAITPAWVKAYCDTVAARTTVRPLVYINQSTQNGQDWSAVVADNDGEWLAKYDGTLTQPTGGPWGAPAMKQYSDAGTVPGITGPVDLDVFYGTDAQLAALGLGGSPTPLEDQMTPEQAAWLAETLARLQVLTKFVGTDAAGHNIFAPADGVDVTALAATVSTLQGEVSALQTAVAALPAQTAQALPSMTCQGNPKAVLSVIGQAATAAAASAP